jgi:hypothetical protein
MMMDFRKFIIERAMPQREQPLSMQSVHAQAPIFPCIPGENRVAMACPRDHLRQASQSP